MSASRAYSSTIPVGGALPISYPTLPAAMRRTGDISTVVATAQTAQTDGTNLTHAVEVAMSTPAAETLQLPVSYTAPPPVRIKGRKGSRAQGRW